MKTNWKSTLSLWGFGLTKIPMILYTRPRIFKIDEDACQVGIKLSRRTKNHLGSIYFGVLGVGADLAAGLLAMHLISINKIRLSLVFKDVQATFHKRVDGDAVFACTDSTEIKALIQKVRTSGERQHGPVHVIVMAPDKYGDEILAEYTLTLSLKEINP